MASPAANDRPPAAARVPAPAAPVQASEDALTVPVSAARVSTPAAPSDADADARDHVDADVARSPRARGQESIPAAAARADDSLDDSIDHPADADSRGGTEADLFGADLFGAPDEIGEDTNLDVQPVSSESVPSDARVHALPDPDALDDDDESTNLVHGAPTAPRGKRATTELELLDEDLLLEPTGVTPLPEFAPEHAGQASGPDGEAGQRPQTLPPPPLAASPPESGLDDAIDGSLGASAPATGKGQRRSKPASVPPPLPRGVVQAAPIGGAPDTTVPMPHPPGVMATEPPSIPAGVAPPARPSSPHPATSPPPGTSPHAGYPAAAQGHPGYPSPDADHGQAGYPGAESPGHPQPGSGSLAPHQHPPHSGHAPHESQPLAGQAPSQGHPMYPGQVPIHNPQPYTGRDSGPHPDQEPGPYPGQESGPHPGQHPAQHPGQYPITGHAPAGHPAAPGAEGAPGQAHASGQAVAPAPPGQRDETPLPGVSTSGELDGEAPHRSSAVQKLAERGQAVMTRRSGARAAVPHPIAAEGSGGVSEDDTTVPVNRAGATAGADRHRAGRDGLDPSPEYIAAREAALRAVIEHKQKTKSGEMPAARPSDAAPHQSPAPPQSALDRSYTDVLAALDASAPASGSPGNLLDIYDDDEAAPRYPVDEAAMFTEPVSSYPPIDPRILREQQQKRQPQKRRPISARQAARRHKGPIPGRTFTKIPFQRSGARMALGLIGVAAGLTLLLWYLPARAPLTPEKRATGTAQVSSLGRPLTPDLYMKGQIAAGGFVAVGALFLLSGLLFRPKAEVVCKRCKRYVIAQRDGIVMKCPRSSHTATWCHKTLLLTVMLILCVGGITVVIALGSIFRAT